MLIVKKMPILQGKHPYFEGLQKANKLIPTMKPLSD